MKELIQAGAHVNAFDLGNCCSALHHASREGHVGCMKELIEGGADVDAYRDKTLVVFAPLMQAVVEGNLESVRVLGAAGADMNKRQQGSSTPLMVSAQKGDSELIRELLTFGANANAQMREGYTAVHVAATCGNADCIEELIRGGAIVNMVDNKGDTALHQSSRLCDIESVEALIHGGADVNLANQLRETPLCLAVRNGHEQFRREVQSEHKLQERDQNVTVDRNETHVCADDCMKPSHRTVLSLLKAGAHVSDVDGPNPLPNPHDDHIDGILKAAGQGDEEQQQKKKTERQRDLCLKNLCHAFIRDHLKEVHHDMNLFQTVPLLPVPPQLQGFLTTRYFANVAVSHSEKSLLQAAEQGHLASIAALLKQGVRRDQVNSEGNTAIMLAAQNGHTDCVLQLLKSGADVNIQNKVKCTALYLSVENRKITILRELIQSKAEVNIQNLWGNTPLMLAVEQSALAIRTLNTPVFDPQHPKAFLEIWQDLAKHLSPETVDTLIKVGSDPNIQNIFGATALMYAPNVAIVHKLIDAGCDLDTRNAYGEMALYLAVKWSKMENLHALIKSGADVNIPTNEGYTALCLTVTNGDLELMKVLLNAGADVNFQDPGKLSPLKIAAFQGYRIHTVCEGACSSSSKCGHCTHCGCGREKSSWIPVLVDTGCQS